ncbi:MAG: transketolase [Halieaceae bacterium]|nr:transketolase [Halieaceae bacterium]
MPTRIELANAIRALSMDAVQQANSGHPGAPMGMADIAEVLWNDYLKHNPGNPDWPDRDRFVLSNGHGSMLLYSLLHLSGYELPIEELKNFRQLHSKTPGHPEYGVTPGVETTTGPLGQGLGNAVGMALAEKVLAAQFNRSGHQVVNHYTYVFVGDGCLMEGISHEVCSLAGTLGLGKLICFYDDNGISIDGEVTGWFSDDTPARFTAYGWQVISGVDGHDTAVVAGAIEQARAESGRPTLICCKTIIGKGAPNKQGTAAVHGAALGADEVSAARQAIGWPHPPFEVPDELYRAWNHQVPGEAQQQEWEARMQAYEREWPRQASELRRRLAGELPADFSERALAYIHQCQQQGGAMASRKASLNCLNAYGPILPEILGGSADLTGSNLTLWDDSRALGSEDADGNYIYYGVREFGMSAITNGIVRHGGFKAYAATFLTFMEYARNAVRMAALMRQPSIFVYTHDSIGLGEDGPTHQPVEQLANLRNTPNLLTWRPCDAVESAVAWKLAIERGDGPSALVFSRQSLPHQQRSPAQVADIERGAYVLREGDGRVDAIIIATGSEVALAMEAAEQLAQEDQQVRVVSMPCTEAFCAQDSAYREQVLPAAVSARVAVEAGIADYWRQFVGLEGRVLGMKGFGESAPAGELFQHFGFTAQALADLVRELI